MDICAYRDRELCQSKHIMAYQCTENVGMDSAS